MKKANQVIEVAARQNRMSLPHLLLALAVVFIELINNPILAAQDIHTFHPQVMFIVIATGNKVNTVNTVSMGNIHGQHGQHWNLHMIFHVQYVKHLAAVKNNPGAWVEFER